MNSLLLKSEFMLLLKSDNFRCRRRGLTSIGKKAAKNSTQNVKSALCATEIWAPG